MAIGPGKYDEICTIVREDTNARAAVVIILGGRYGSGFSVQAEGRDLTAHLPDLLDELSKQIRDSLKGNI